MGSNGPSAASSYGPGDPRILSERSCSTSNTFLVAKDDWVQGLMPSPGTLVGHVGLGRLFLRHSPSPLQLCFFSGLVPGIPLDVCPGESMIPDVDGTTLIAAPPSDRPS